MGKHFDSGGRQFLGSINWPKGRAKHEIHYSCAAAFLVLLAAAEPFSKNYTLISSPDFPAASLEETSTVSLLLKRRGAQDLLRDRRLPRSLRIILAFSSYGDI